MTAPAPCPIYTVGDGSRTQMAVRPDGVWFMRRKGIGFTAGMWQAWERMGACPYPFGKYIDKRAGNARLPDE